MTAASSPRRLWCLLVAFAACYFALFGFFPLLFRYFGVNDYGIWFLDSYAILASNDAVGIGRDAYTYNPLDPFGRAHVYSHWWLHLRNLGLTRGDNLRFGLAFVLAFFVAAVAWLRPRELREIPWYLVVLGSPPFLLALDRANNDLVVFVLLAPVVPCLLAARRDVRSLPILFIALAAGLKFYPAAAGLVLLAGVDAREVRSRVLAGALTLALVAVDIAPDIARFGGNAPRAEGLMTFGAVNVFAMLGLDGGRALVLVGALATAIVIYFWRSRWFADWEIAPADRAAWLSFTLGAALLAGCFFTGRNFAYRWVFALWLAPLLWRLPRDSQAPARVRRLATLTAALLVVLLWLDPLVSSVMGFSSNPATAAAMMRWADRILLCEQSLTWAFFACLLGFLAHFTRGGVRTLFARE